jgi:hypothetical protein
MINFRKHYFLKNYNYLLMIIKNLILFNNFWSMKLLLKIHKKLHLFRIYRDYDHI